MARQIIGFTIVIAALVAAIAYSQLRPTSDTVSGILEADEIRVGSRVGGRVESVRVAEGEKVEDGQLLLTLEPYDLIERRREATAALAAKEAEYERLSKGYREEEVAQAKARLDQLTAEYDKLKNGPRKQEIEVARARLAAAHAQQTLAARSHDRVRSLRERGATTADELDRAGEELESASANVVLREQELDLLLAGTRQEELVQASARVAEARAGWQLNAKGYRSEDIRAAAAARDASQHALDAINRQIDELKIVSPLDGTVDALVLQKGDLIAPSAPVLALVDLQDLWVRAYVPQNRVAIKVGQRFNVLVDAFPDRVFPGTVTFISRQAEFTPSNVQTPEERSKLVFRMKVAIKNSERLLRPGMSATLELSQSEPVDD